MKGVIAGTAVAGLDLSLNRWVAHASAGPDTIPIPELDGALVLEPEARAEAADDFGHIISHMPVAVLYPGSVDDVVTMVRYANDHRLHIAGMSMVGDCHSAYGQAQVNAGIVVNMASLCEIHEINPGDALVDAGVRWRDLVARTFALGKSPPTLTDYTGLSVGGTLSVGGIGGQAHQWGLMVDNVLELEVVTGTGELRVCSPRRNRHLFDRVRGGLGQFGIIVRARVRLRDVPPRARVYKLLYRDIARFTADQELLMAEERFDYLEGDIFRAEDGESWVFRLEATTYFEPGAPPDDARMLEGLSFEPGSADIRSMGYLDFIYRLDPVVEMLKNLGLWAMPHPWLNLFLPAETAPWLVQRVLERTPAEDMGGGPILLYPFKKSAVHAQYPVLPPGDTCYLFSLLRTAVPGTPENAARLVAENRAIFELARAHGATVYPISAVPLTRWDWRFHFWPWFDFLGAKRRFDPNLILTPGQNIFAR